MKDFQEWRTEQKKIEADKGVNFFLEIPDSWVNDGESLKFVFSCKNAHVSNTYLKSEALGYNACFTCSQPVYLIPHWITEEQLINDLTPQQSE